MKIAVVCSNNELIGPETKKGTEIFVRQFLEGFARYSDSSRFTITVFAAGSSRVPYPLQSIERGATGDDPAIAKRGKHIMFELALLSRAFERQDEFDLYHIHIGDGDLVMPFLPFVKKPILVTLHHLYDEDFTRRYFSLFRNWLNISFIAVSEYQRRLLSCVRYAATIHHGIDTDNPLFSFASGGERMMWAGRAIPEKGMKTAIDIARHTARAIALFGIRKPEHYAWLEKEILGDSGVRGAKTGISLFFDYTREQLAPHFQASKLFLFPVEAEESFGLVLIEALACGVPIVAYARGGIPEIVSDTETGFLVNPSDDDIRGNWTVKKTGIQGLCEAVERIYALRPEEYAAMRRACRERVERHFSIRAMVHSYEKAYASAMNESAL